jgi:hypothetical protein
MNNLGSLSAVAFGLQAFVTLLVILDPPGATPFFLALVGDRTLARMRSSLGVASGQRLTPRHRPLSALFGKVRSSDYLHVLDSFGLARSRWLAPASVIPT